MGKLHEILVVEEDKKGISNKIKEEAIKTFKDKQAHFVEKIEVYKPLAEGEQNIVESHTTMVTTVKEKLAYISNAVCSHIDAFYQKEATNTYAKADIMIGDHSLLKDVPATALLALERELNSLLQLFDAIPTLEPGIDWQSEPQRGENIRSSTQNRGRTKKILKPVELTPATKEHPAQFEKIYEDITVGYIETKIYTSKMSSAEKAELMERLNTLKTAIKTARKRANNADADKRKIGKVLFDYINEGKL